MNIATHIDSFCHAFSHFIMIVHILMGCSVSTGPVLHTGWDRSSSMPFVLMQVMFLHGRSASYFVNMKQMSHEKLFCMLSG